MNMIQILKKANWARMTVKQLFGLCRFFQVVEVVGVAGSMVW